MLDSLTRLSMPSRSPPQEGQLDQAVKFLELSLKMTHAIYGTSSVHVADVMEALAAARLGVMAATRDARERDGRKNGSGWSSWATGRFGRC